MTYPFSFCSQELISGLLTMDDTIRLTADEMLQHAWVAVSLHSSRSLNALIYWYQYCIHFICINHAVNYQTQCDYRVL